MYDVYTFIGIFETLLSDLARSRANVNWNPKGKITRPRGEFVRSVQYHLRARATTFAFDARARKLTDIRGLVGASLVTFPAPV